LGLSYSPSQYFKTFKKIRRDWSNINQRSFNRSIKKLSKDKLLEEQVLTDGSFKLVLTREGKRQAKILDLLGSSINFKKPKRWDGKWRVVLFDIPEKDKIFRNILRTHLYTLNFFKLQHSVFVSPLPLEKQVAELATLYSATPYVRIITATKIDNESKLKKHFATFIK